MATDKSPRSDGFSIEFFQTYWHIVGNVTSKAIRAFFHSGKMIKEINHTFIALIPKKDQPITTNDFRPISICNTSIKIIAKILANRLKKVLPKLIHPFQGAFTPDRDIQDNILIAHDIFHSFKSKKGKMGLLAIKLDMEKTYDRLE